jgi:putative tryptophan/tyrosine transport system substrate-binding protein
VRLARSQCAGKRSYILPTRQTLATKTKKDICRLDLIVALATRLRLPAIYPFAFYVKAGGLISYSFDPLNQFRQGAEYVDRILRDAKPADLPVQYPTKFQLVINLTTAKTLGFAVPASFLSLADAPVE